MALSPLSPWGEGRGTRGRHDFFYLNQMGIEVLAERLASRLGEAASDLRVAYGELTLSRARTAGSADCPALRDDASLGFEQLIDLCGVRLLDVRRSPVGRAALCGRRPPSVRFQQLENCGCASFCVDDEFPVTATLTPVWPQPAGTSARPSTCTDRVRRPSRSAPDTDRLRFCRSSIPQGLPHLRPGGDALRPRAEARDLSAGHDRAARSDAARDPRNSYAKR